MGLGRYLDIKLTVIAAAMGIAAAMISHDALAQSSMLLASTGTMRGPLFGREVPPTVGAAQWCSADPTEPFCRGVDAYKPLHLDKSTAAEITKINLAVNKEIEPVDDIVQWGMPEKWNRPLRGADGRLQDDCDGYVIEKWYRLVREHGLPKDAFYPLYAEVPGYGGHLVLAVVTDGGTFVLNNLTSEIVPLRSFTFTYLKRPRAGRNLDRTWERFLAWGDVPDPNVLTAQVVNGKTPREVRRNFATGATNGLWPISDK